MTRDNNTKRVQTIVIGGGQAGLAMGYHLAKRGIPFRILDAHQRIGDSWRNRWDSLRLFTPARHVGLPGLKFSTRGDAFPTKEQMADYLESYAAHFHLPLETGVRVDRMTKHNGLFYVKAGERRYEAEQVIVAMANYQIPRVPEYASQLDPKIRQLHSHEYRNPSQLQEGGVLVVGVGNSGADIAMEVSRTHRTWLAGKETGHVPFRIETALSRWVLFRIVKFIGHHVLSMRTPIGRRLQSRLVRQHAPLIRVKPDDLIAAGIQRVPRVIGVHKGRPQLETGAALDVSNVIWCTGYDPGFSWIDLPIFDQHGTPVHKRGVVANMPGLFFVGLHYQYAMTSATLMGVGRDAEYIARAVERHSRCARPSVVSAA